MSANMLTVEKYNTDKIGNRYLDWYDPIFHDLADDPVRLLELGVKNGGSLDLWLDYFPEGRICGIDHNLANLTSDFSGNDRVSVFQGEQQDTAFLTRVASKVAPDGFDIIIDDASHNAELSRVSFWHLFENHLRPGGWYVIEDWTAGYRDDWSDGRSFRRRPAWRAAALRGLKRLGLIRSVPSDTHLHGLVGFVKELIDEQRARDVEGGPPAYPHCRNSRFAKMIIHPSVVFVHKPSAET